MKRLLSSILIIGLLATLSITLCSYREECGGVNSTTYYEGDWDVYVLFTNYNDFMVDVEYTIEGKTYGSTGPMKELRDGTCSIPAKGTYKVYLPSYTTRGYTRVYRTVYRYR